LWNTTLWGTEQILKDFEFLDLLASIVQIGVEELSMSTKLDSIGWDSLSNLSLIAKLDELLGMQVDANLLMQAETIEDLFKLLSV
jgi:acyl carrier protein